MIKKVERWEAEDGSLFETLEDCEYHEAKQGRISHIYEHLGYDASPEEIYDYIAQYTRGWK